MPLLHSNLSIVEVIALAIAGLLVLTVVIGVLYNLPGLVRYIRISRM
jgi:hypothetical protein